MSRVPMRIQRKRTKGWKMPADAIYVGRPTKWGNPFLVGMWVHDGDPIEYQHRATRAEVVEMHADFMAGLLKDKPPTVDELRGHDLACWCPVGVPCHADLLLKLANPVGAGVEL